MSHTFALLTIGELLLCSTTFSNQVPPHSIVTLHYANVQIAWWIMQVSHEQHQGTVEDRLATSLHGGTPL
jgi:hypothetical protein